MTGRQDGQRVRKESVWAGRAPPGLPFSPGIKLGELLFISGQGPFDGNGKLVEGDIKAQTRTTLENFKSVVEDGGSEVDDVLQTTVYLKDLNEYSGMNEVYATFFSEPRPARTTVQVAGLLFGMRIEVQGIAHISSEPHRARR